MSAAGRAGADLLAFNATRAAVVAARVSVADTPSARAQGLLGRDSLPAQEGLWIIPCAMIHTFFMKFPIDVVFLDSRLRVRRIVENMRPWRLSPWVFSAHSVLELKAESLNGAVRIGDQIEMRPS